MIEHHNFVYSVKKEQLKKLETHQYDKYPKALLMNDVYEQRILAGLEQLCQQILKDEEKGANVQ